MNRSVRCRLARKAHLWRAKYDSLLAVLQTDSAPPIRKTLLVIRGVVRTVYAVIGQLYALFGVWTGNEPERFLPESLLVSARRWYSSSVILHFSLVYILRELIMVSALGYYRQSAAQRQRLHALTQHQLQTELDSLKTQLQPHFFFNTLNNIYSLALQQSIRTAPLIARHADIMRYILYRAKRQRVPLTEEVKFLTDYVAVESLRFSDQATIQFDTQGIHDRVCIEPLLPLPFIDNTFKHGLRQDIHGGFVHIVLVLIETELMLVFLKG